MTDTMKHTPDPWVEGPKYGDLMTEVLGSDGRRAVALVWTHAYNPASTKDTKFRPTTPHPEGMANLALIKAAPDLLAVASYFDYAASNRKVGALSNDEYVTITVTVKSIQDAAAALAAIRGEQP